MVKYVLASVEMPIRINDNNDFEVLNDYTQTHIIRFINSPDDIQINNLSIKEQINNLLEKQEPINNNDIPIVINKCDIKHNDHVSNNISFKNKKHIKNNKTFKRK